MTGQAWAKVTRTAVPAAGPVPDPSETVPLVLFPDVAGVAPSEVIYIIKPDLDAPPESGRYV